MKKNKLKKQMLMLAAVMSTGVSAKATDTDADAGIDISDDSTVETSTQAVATHNIAEIGRLSEILNPIEPQSEIVVIGSYQSLHPDKTTVDPLAEAHATHQMTMQEFFLSAMDEGKKYQVLQFELSNYDVVESMCTLSIKGKNAFSRLKLETDERIQWEFKVECAKQYLSVNLVEGFLYKMCKALLAPDGMLIVDVCADVVRRPADHGSPVAHAPVVRPSTQQVLTDIGFTVTQTQGICDDTMRGESRDRAVKFLICTKSSPEPVTSVEDFFRQHFSDMILQNIATNPDECPIANIAYSPRQAREIADHLIGLVGTTYEGERITYLDIMKMASFINHTLGNNIIDASEIISPISLHTGAQSFRDKSLEEKFGRLSKMFHRLGVTAKLNVGYSQ